MLASILLLLLFAGAGLYILLTPKDVDPEFLLHQASVSPTKLPGESPVVRSLVNPHGHALLGETKPLNAFRFKDVWKDSGSFKIQYVTKTGQLKTVSNFASLVSKVQAAISDYPADARIGMRFDVGLEALVAFFAVSLSGRVPLLIDEDEEEDRDSEHEQVVLKQTEFKFAGETSGISARRPDGSWVVLSLLGSGDSAEVEQKSTETPILEHIYLVNEEAVDEQTYIGGATEPQSVPRAQTLRLSLSEAELGSAIASQLLALGSQHRWNRRDTVFMASGPLSVYSFVTMLTALSATSTLVFAEIDPLLTATAVMHAAKPSVVVSNDETMRTLVKHVDDFQVLKWIEYGWRRLRLARGALTQPPMIKEFRHVRLIHTESGADPYKWLSNADIAALRVLTSTQVVHTYTPTNDVPYCQTSIGDYRTKPAAKDYTGVNWGPPLPGIELKKTGPKTLVVRGARSKAWTALPEFATEDAMLLKDGCLYVPEKRHDFSEYYYYTGELN